MTESEYTDKPWRNQERLEELYFERKMTIREMADELGCSSPTVSRWMGRFDIEGERDRYKYEDTPWRNGQKLYELYHEGGLTQSEIADKFGCSVQTIQRQMEKNDIETEHGTKRQYSDTPWNDRDLLYEMYIEKRMPTTEISNELGCTPRTISRKLNDFGIPIRDHTRRPARFFTDENGYERLRDGYTKDVTTVHQLLMLLEHPPDEVFDPENCVHHSNHIRWDNRLENLELMTVQEHGRYHALERRNRGEFQGGK